MNFICTSVKFHNCQHTKMLFWSTKQKKKVLYFHQKHVKMSLSKGKILNSEFFNIPINAENLFSWHKSRFFCTQRQLSMKFPNCIYTTSHWQGNFMSQTPSMNTGHSEVKSNTSHFKQPMTSKSFLSPQSLPIKSELTEARMMHNVKAARNIFQS